MVPKIYERLAGREVVGTLPLATPIPSPPPPPPPPPTTAGAGGRERRRAGAVWSSPPPPHPAPPLSGARAAVRGGKQWRAALQQAAAFVRVGAAARDVAVARAVAAACAVAAARFAAVVRAAGDVHTAAHKRPRACDCAHGAVRTARHWTGTGRAGAAQDGRGATSGGHVIDEASEVQDEKLNQGPIWCQSRSSP
ncbi:unnamed protein product [Closterium sp. NIES-53]